MLLDPGPIELYIDGPGADEPLAEEPVTGNTGVLLVELRGPGVEEDDGGGKLSLMMTGLLRVKSVRVMITSVLSG